MAQNLYSLQLLRNGNVFSSYTEAVNEVQTGSLADGVIKLARYKDASTDPYSGGTGGNVKTIFAIRHSGIDNQSGWTIFESYKEVVDEIREKIDEMSGEGAGSIAEQIKAAIDRLNSRKDAGESEVFSAVYQDSGVTSASTRNLSTVKLAGYTAPEGTNEDNTADANKVAAADTLGDALAKLQKQINSMDQTVTKTDGDVIVSLTEADGIVTVGKAKASSLLMNDYTKGNTDDKVTTGDTIGEAISKLENQIETVSANTDDIVSNLTASSVANDNKVITDVTQTDGKITATASNLTGIKLDGYTVGGDDSAKVADTDTLGQALGKLQGQINGMDKAASAVGGQVVTTVAQADGKVTETKENVKDLQLGGYEKNSSATGSIASNDTINAALSKLENNIDAAKSATTVASADNSINVTTAATGTDINVNIKEGEHVLAKGGNAGLYTNIALSSITPSSTTVREEYQLTATDGTKLGDTIKIYKDSSISKIYLGYPTDTVDATSGVITSGTTGEAQSLNYVYHKEDGTYEMVHVDVSKFLAESEFKSGVTVDNAGVVHGVVDPTSESFLTVGADGFKLAGVQAAINAASGNVKTKLDELSGKTVTAVEMTGGTAAIADNSTDGTKKITINADGSTLSASTNYASAQTASAVAAGDSIDTALGKLEAQVAAAKAAATTKVVEGTDAGNNLEIVPTTGADQSVTYTINLTDVASDSALTAEIAARKAVDGQNGQTYAANTSANYISTATSLNDADVKLDTELKKVEDEIGLVNSEYQAPASGYASGATTVSQAIAQLNEQAMKNTIVAGDGIEITEAANGTTIAVDLKDNAGEGDNDWHNPLMFDDNDKLYFDSLDCGTY